MNATPRSSARGIRWDFLISISYRVTHLPAQMLVYVLTRFFFRVDLVSELIGLRLHAPIDVLGDERHVVVVRLAIAVEDPDLPAYILEKIGLERRFTGCQGGAVQPVFLVQ